VEAEQCSYKNVR